MTDPLEAMNMKFPMPETMPGLMREMLLVVSLAGNFALAGCASRPVENRLPCVPVQGELFVGGQPAAGAELLFQPLDASAERWLAGMPHALVRDDGTFAVETYETKDGVADGAPEGEYIVLVKWLTKPTVPQGERAGDDHAPYDRLFGKHYNPATATLRAKIAAPLTILPRFQL